jgi:hypothetical protein
MLAARCCRPGTPFGPSGHAAAAVAAAAAVRLWAVWLLPVLSSKHVAAAAVRF